MAYISFQPEDFFNTVLYSGTGSSNAVTGVGFQPDLTWVKARNYTYDNGLVDAVRGVQETIKSNDAGAESTISTGLTAFGADGFTVISDNIFNGGGGPLYASWNWKAGTTTGINLDSATLTPSAYSFNQTAGFSIIKWRGVSATAPNTIPHGLGKKPDMIWVKNITSGDSWNVYHTSMGATKYLYLDNADPAVTTSATRWNDTEPTTTKFTTNTNGGVAGGSTEDLIAYCFTSIKGYSKAGSFIGNMSTTNGPFVETGFRPACVIIRNTATTNRNWGIWNNKSLGYNPENYGLYPNEVGIENTGDVVDLYSNGFKVSTNDNGYNGTGNELIYFAIAESPIVSSNDVPTVAR